MVLFISFARSLVKLRLTASFGKSNDPNSVFKSNWEESLWCSPHSWHRPEVKDRWIVDSWVPGAVKTVRFRFVNSFLYSEREREKKGERGRIMEWGDANQNLSSSACMVTVVLITYRFFSLTSLGNDRSRIQKADFIFNRFDQSRSDYYWTKSCAPRS